MTDDTAELNKAIAKTGRDPLSMSAVYEKAIDAGKTPEEAADAEARSVFGEDYKIDRAGNPIEVGIGSVGRETTAHRAALEKEAYRRRLAAEG